MGVQKGISRFTFPAQGSHLAKKVKVCFNYDTSETIFGKIIRDDAVAPFLTIIELNDGRIVLATECQFSVI